MYAQTRNDPTAWARLNRHMTELVENRAISATDAAGGEFVPPMWLLDSYAPYARSRIVGAALATNLVLPSGTDSINIPTITTGSKSAIQVGNNASVTTRDLITSSVSGNVETFAGYVDASVQLVEQSPIAAGIDQLIFRDLMADLDLALESAVVGTGSGSSNTLKGFVTVGHANVVTWTETTPTAANMLINIQKAVSSVVTNRYDAPTAILMHPSMWYWLSAQVDGTTNNRPLILPSANGAFNAQGTVSNPGAANGLVGNIAGLPVYISAAMTKTYSAGTNQSPILIGKFDDSYLFTSGVKTRVFPDVNSGTLGVRFSAYKYGAIAHRFAKSIVSVDGTGSVAPSGY